MIRDDTRQRNQINVQSRWKYFNGSKFLQGVFKQYWPRFWCPCFFWRKIWRTRTFFLFHVFCWAEFCHRTDKHLGSRPCLLIQSSNNSYKSCLHLWPTCENWNDVCNEIIRGVLRKNWSTRDDKLSYKVGQILAMMKTKRELKRLTISLGVIWIKNTTNYKS